MIGHTGMIIIKRLFALATVIAILLLVGCAGVVEFNYANDSVPNDNLSKCAIKKYYDYDFNVTCYSRDLSGGLSCIEGLRK